MTSRILILLFTLLLLTGIAQAGEANDPRFDALPDMEALSPSEEGIVRIEIAGITAADMPSRYVGDSLFVPYLAFCDMLRISATISTDGLTLQGEVSPEQSFEISRTSSTARVGTRTMPVSATAIRMIDGEAFVEQSLLASVLGISVNYEPQLLKLTVSADERLPIVQYAHRTEGYALLEDADGTTVTPHSSITRSLFGAPMLNWELSGTMSTGVQQSFGGTVRLGGEFLYGTLDLFAIGSVQPATGNQSLRIDGASWRFRIPESSLLSQLTLGSLVLDQRQVQGVELTNAPLSPRHGLGIYELSGQSRPGWTVELYESNKLIDVTTADSLGMYRFRIRMAYGTVDHVTKEIGPYGEIITREHRMQFNQEMLPTGVVEYHLGAGVDSLRSTSSLRSNARLSIGLFNRLTLGAEAIYRAPSINSFSADSILPTAYASAWLGGGTSLGLRYDPRGGVASGELYALQPSNALIRLAVDSAALSGHYAASASASLPVWQTTLGASARYADRSWGRELSVEPQISGYAAGINFIASTRYTRTVPTGITTPVTTLQSNLRMMVSPFSWALISAEAAYDHNLHTISSLNISTYHRLGERVGLNLSYNIPQLDWRHGMFNCQLSLDFDAFNVTGMSTYQDGRSGNNVFAHGGAIISAQGIHTTRNSIVGEGTVLIAAFHDRNGNGRRDDGEESLNAPRAYLTSDGSQITSENGFIRGLMANQQCVVDIDRWSHADLDLYPTRSTFSFYTSPSGVETIEVPFAEGFDVTGMCVIENGDVTPALARGLRVHLMDDRNGNRFDGEIFSDGTLLFSGVCPGTYRIEFDADQISQRHLVHIQPDASVTISRTSTQCGVIRIGRNDPGLSK